MHRSIVALTAVALLASASSAFAAPCKDAKGRFTKCPAPAATAMATNRCRDAKTKAFAKCGTPGAEPMPMAAAMKKKP